jgi:hypothetical protein
MKKTLKYTRNGVIVGGIGCLIINFVKQLNRKNDSPDSKFDWEEFLKAGGKGALIGGGFGLIAGGITDINNSNQEPLNTSSILNAAISNLTLNKQDHSYKWLSNKAVKIENFIVSKFKQELGGTIARIGSTEENTALTDDFDIDLIVPFAPLSFPSIESMYDELYCFIENNFSDEDLIKIRPQKKSIGLIFNLDGDEYKIDVVPYKLSPKKGNKTSGYLFVNNNSFFKNDTFTKTDIAKLKEIKLNPTQQKIHVAIKNWKRNFDVPLSSHLAKHLIMEAYIANQGIIPRDFTKKLIMVIRHIHNQIQFTRIISVENTNNILTNIVPTIKEQIQISCNDILEDYDYQPNSILNYFT